MGNTLLLRVHRGDERAARELWDGLAPALVASVRAAHPAAPAEDAVQEAFVALLAMRRGDVKKVADARAWMHRLARNAAVNMMRGDGRRRARERAASSAERVQAGGADDRVDLSVLDNGQREVVVLRHVAQLTFDQIALVLDEPRSTLASRYQAAVTRLRVNLEPACCGRVQERAEGGRPCATKASI